MSCYGDSLSFCFSFFLEHHHCHLHAEPDVNFDSQDSTQRVTQATMRLMKVDVAGEKYSELIKHYKNFVKGSMDNSVILWLGNILSTRCCQMFREMLSARCCHSSLLSMTCGSYVCSPVVCLQDKLLSNHHFQPGLLDVSLQVIVQPTPTNRCLLISHHFH